jgi:hypothetical protein
MIWDIVALSVLAALPLRLWVLKQTGREAGASAGLEQ